MPHIQLFVFFLIFAVASYITADSIMVDHDMYCMKKWENTDSPNPRFVLHDRNICESWSADIRHIHCGLVNVGNSCYLNSSLQALFHIPAFLDMLYSDEAHRKECISSSGCITCCLYRTHLNMQGKKVWKPLGVVNLLKKINPNLENGKQEDAYEFLISMINQMQMEFLSRFGNMKLDHCSEETTALKKVFGGWMEREDICSNCSRRVKTYESVTHVVVMPEGDSVESALIASITKVEEIDCYKCDGCKKVSSCHRAAKFHTYPAVLKVVISRFGPYGTSHAIKSKLKINQSLTIGSGCYNFVSGIIHHGDKMREGHYTGIAVCPNKSYVTFNDSIVTEYVGDMTSKESEEGIYVAFYQLQHFVTSTPMKRCLPSTPSRRSPYSKKLKTPFKSPSKSPFQKAKGKCPPLTPKRSVKKFRKLIFSGFTSKNCVLNDTEVDPSISEWCSPVIASTPITSEAASSNVEDHCSSFISEINDDSEILATALEEQSDVLLHQLQHPIQLTLTNVNNDDPATPLEESVLKGVIADGTDKIVPSLVICRKPRLGPKCSSTQSSHEYNVVDKGTTGGEKVSISPLLIRRRPRTEPKAHSTQSSHEYNVVNRVNRFISPLVIGRKPGTEPKENSMQSSQIHALNTNCSGYVRIREREDESSDDSVSLCESIDIFDSEHEGGSSTQLSDPEEHQSFDCPVNDVVSPSIPASMHPSDPQEHQQHTESPVNDVDSTIIPSNNFVNIVLEPKDVPGAILPKPIIEDNCVKDLKRWLECRGIDRMGKKIELIKKVKDCIAMGRSHIIDPKIDGGVWYELKRKKLLQAQVCHLPSDLLVFPINGWNTFPSSDIPENYNFGSIFHYLIETMPTCNDNGAILDDDEIDCSGDEDFDATLSDLILDPSQRNNPLSQEMLA